MIKLKDLKVRNKMLLLIGIFAAGFAAFGFFAYSTLNTLKVNGPVYSEIQSEIDVMRDVNPPSVYLLEVAYNTARLQALVDKKDQEGVVKRIDRIKQNIDRYYERIEYWKQKLPEGKLRELILEKSHKPAEATIKIIQTEVFPAALEGDYQKIRELNNGVLHEVYTEHRMAVDEIRKLSAENLKAHEAKAAEMVYRRTGYLIAIAVAITALVILLGWLIGRSITGPLRKVVEKLRLMSDGDVEQDFDYRSKDEIGELADSFRSTSGYIKEVAGVVSGLGKGDLSRTIEPRSGKDLLATNLNQAIESLRGLSSETQTLIKEAEAGNLGARGDAAKFSGAYAELVGGINKMMDNVVLPINQALVEAFESLEKVAQCDLRARMRGDYKGDLARLKTALNDAVENLNRVLSRVAVGAEQVASASQQISAGSATLAQGASEQASTLEEVSSSVQEIFAMSRQNASNAKEARALSDNARQTAEAGAAAMDKLSEAVERIKHSSDSTAKIVRTIEEIAFQTNLLALNAAVEAARAGDAGKGFAVVAEEVRNLAMRSAEAAKQTATMIEESVSNTEAGVAHNQEVLGKLSEINAQVEKVSIVIAEIAAASEQQTSGIDQINIAIEQMNAVTQQTAANSEESASAAEELSAQSDEMLEMIGRFALTAETRGHPGRDRRAAAARAESAPDAFAF